MGDDAVINDKSHFDTFSYIALERLLITLTLQISTSDSYGTLNSFYPTSAAGFPTAELVDSNDRLLECSSNMLSTNG